MIIRSSLAVADLVPFADRIRWLRTIRISAALLVPLIWIALPDLRTSSDTAILVSTGAYLALAIASDLLWRVIDQRALLLFGAMLLIDGLYLAGAAYMTGNVPTSPVVFLVLVHLVSVSLLASFRTGLKIAFWDTLLVFIVVFAQEGGLLPDHTGVTTSLADPEFRLVLAFAAACWLVAVAASSFAAVNERELARRRYDLEALARLGLRLEGTTDTLSVGDALTRSVADELGFTRVLLFASAEDELVLVAQRGAERAGHTIPASQRRQSLVARAAADRRTLLISRFEYEDDERLAYLLPEARNLILVPLHAEGRAVGVLVCEHGEERGSRVERRVVTILERFCSQAGLALDNARLLEQLERTAATDGLTGLPNRRTFDRAIGREIARAGRTGDSVSVVLVDLDHFKSVNDRHGHLVGDDVLRRVARALDAGVRGEDTPARFGGEEFAIIMPTHEKTQGIAAAERLRTAIKAELRDLAITASFGVATVPADGTDAVAVLHAADKALYDSKRSGRDRVTAAAGTGPHVLGMLDP